MAASTLVNEAGEELLRNIRNLQLLSATTALIFKPRRLIGVPCSWHEPPNSVLRSARLSDN
jgi:hypothetical protein